MWEPIWMGLYSLKYCTMPWFAPCETQNSLDYFQKFGSWEQQDMW